MTLLTKLYWPVVVLYCIYLLTFTILYFTEMHNWTNRSNYNWMNFQRLVVPSLFLGASWIARNQGNQKVANIILYVPIGFLTLILVGGLLILLMYTWPK